MCWLTDVALALVKWISKAHWPAILAESMSFRVKTEAVSKKKKSPEQSRKATDIDLWPPHAESVYMCMCALTVMSTHPHEHVHVPKADTPHQQ